MASANTQVLTGLTLENKTFYERTLLERLLPNLQYAKYGTKKNFNKNEGDTIQFRRFESLSPAITALTEGVTPDGQNLSISQVTATVKQYGAYVTLSDKIQTIGIDPVLTETSQLLGEQAALSIDTIVRDIVVAGTNVQYANGVAGRSSVAANITGTELRKAQRTFRKNRVKPFDGKYYIAMVSPEVAFDLQADAMWQDVSKYSNAEQIYTGEIGCLYGFKVVVVDNMAIFSGAGAGSKDVHATILLGKDPYSVVDVGGSGNVEIIVKPSGSGEDPLNQRATAAWKCMFTAVRTNELSLLRLETLCS